MRIPLELWPVHSSWTALGIFGTVVLGVVVLNESLDLFKITSLMLIVLAVIGLRISSSNPTKAVNSA